MSKDTLKTNTAQQQTKSNVITFPIRNSNSINALPQTVVNPKYNQEKLQPLETVNLEKDESILLIFEMLVVLKEQLDTIENKLKALSIP